MSENNFRLRIRNMMIRVKAFLIVISSSKEAMRNITIFNVIYLVLYFYSKSAHPNMTSTELFWFNTNNFICWIIITAFIVFIVGGGLSNWIYKCGFEEIGLKNKTGAYPQLLRKKQNGKSIELTFASSGISYDIWEDQILKIENALDITISQIQTGRRDFQIIVKGYDGKYDWNKSIPWTKRYINKIDNNLTIGRSVEGNILISLDTYAHILIGGMTGSGKTILLKQLLLQCIVKDYQVYIADFKLGVDYTNSWKKKCIFVTTTSAVINNLKEITTELDNRLTLFAEHGCKDINAFNEMIDGKIDRIVFACDELAELLDTTGMSKEEKAQIKEIESCISKIARLGRAVGIHLILATQRPDADVLNGQIKSNMTYRLCGRANEVLSRIILDSTDASKLIPTDSRGIFINQDGLRIKGFDIKNEDLERSLK